MSKPKLIRITTVSRSLNKLLEEQLAYMGSAFEVIGIASPDHTSEIFSKREKVRFIPIYMTRRITLFQDLKSLWNLILVLRKEKPAIVHTHTPKAGLLGMIASYFAGVKIRMHTVAGLPLESSTGLKKKILLIMERITYGFSTNVYPNSYGLESFLLDNKLATESKIKVIGNGSSNGINLEIFKRTEQVMNDVDKLKEKYKIRTQDKVFCFIGRIVKDKGIEELLQAWKLLLKSHTDIKLLLVGGYEDKLDPISNKAREIIKNEKSVLYCGVQKDVRPFFVISHVFVFPSYREGLPNVLLQAGAMGIPIIATEINGNTDIVKSGENGILVPRQQYKPLIKAMKLLLEDKVLYSHLKSRAREVIVDKYDRVSLHSCLLDEYQTLMSK